MLLYNKNGTVEQDAFSFHRNVAVHKISCGTQLLHKTLICLRSFKKTSYEEKKIRIAILILIDFFGTPLGRIIHTVHVVIVLAPFLTE